MTIHHHYHHRSSGGDPNYDPNLFLKLGVAAAVIYIYPPVILIAGAFVVGKWLYKKI